MSLLLTHVQFTSCAQLAILQVNIAQPAFTCSKLTIETLEQRVKYV